jgi:hypothetical protein
MYMKAIGIIAGTLFCTVAAVKADELSSKCFNTESNINYSNKSDTLRISLNDGLLCLNARDVSIEEVVGEIVRISGIRGWIFTGSQEKITMEFHDIPLQEGLEKILKNKNYGIYYNQDDSIGALQVVKSKSVPFTTSTSTSIAGATSPVGSPGVSDKIRKATGQAVYRRGHRKNRVSNATRSGRNTPDVQVSKKKDLNDMLENVDTSRISGLLTEVFNTSVSGFSSADVAKIIDKWTTAGGGAQGSMSGDVTEQQLVDTLLSNVNYVELNNLLSLDSIK